jgi:hypothetical protein
MPKLSTHALSLSLLSAAILAALAVVPSQCQGQEKAQSQQALTTEKKAVRVPFRGKIHSVDKAAKTVTLDGKEKKRVIHITPQTRIAKAGKPAKLEDAMVGEEVGGQALRNGDGKEEAVSLRLGPKPEAKAGAQDKTLGDEDP